MGKFIVETRFLGDTWENVWSVNEEPQTFETVDAAKAEIDELFEDVKEAGMDGYDREDYRIFNTETNEVVT